MPPIKKTAKKVATKKVSVKDTSRKMTSFKASQQGNENQREWFNGVRGSLATDQTGNRQKWSKQKSKSEKWSAPAKAQRAGGKGK